MRAQSVESFLISAVRGAGSWVVVLEFRPTCDEEADWSWLSCSLPWLPDLGQGRGLICEDLRRHGLGLVIVEGEEEARRCFEMVEGYRVSARVFTSAGEKVDWPREDRRPRRRRASRGALT
jgi:hypothetical protein